MRVRSHALTGLAFFSVLMPWTSGGWLNIGIGVFGSMLPDWLEVSLIPALTLGRVRVAFFDTERQRGVFYFQHRGFFHDVGLYLVLWISLFLWDVFFPVRIPGFGPVWLNLVALGAVWHLACDMGSASGVPVFGHTVALGLYRTGRGEWSEWGAVFSVCGVCAVVLVLRDRWDAIWGAVSGMASRYGEGILMISGGVLLCAVAWFGLRLWAARRRGPVPVAYGRVSMLDIVRNYRYGPGRRIDECKMEEKEEAAEGASAEGIPEWRHDVLRIFWEAVAGFFRDPGKRDVLWTILGLLDAHGDVSSVHGEDRGGVGTHDVLSRVSLLDHSLHVARVGLRVLRRDYPDTYVTHVPGVVYGCLLHDIGKADSLVSRESGYSRDDHALDGSRFALDFLADAGVDEKLRQDIADAIRSHHTRDGSGTLVGTILIEADRVARREEYESLVSRTGAEKAGPREVPEKQPEKSEKTGEPEKIEKEKEPEKTEKDGSPGEGAEKPHSPGEAAGKAEPLPVAADVTAPDVMDRIASHVAAQPVEPVRSRVAVEPVVLPEGFGEAVLLALREFVNFPKERAMTELNEWRSVSQPDGFVYLKLDFAGEVIREVAAQRGEKDYALLSDDQQDMRGRVLGWCDWLRERKWLHEAIRPGFFSQRYKVYDGITRREFVVALIAVRVEAFGLRAGEAEDERRNYPRLRHLTVRGVAGRDAAPAEGGDRDGAFG